MNTELREELIGQTNSENMIYVNIAELIDAVDQSVDSFGKTYWLEEIIAMKIPDQQMGFLIDSLLRYGFTAPINVVWRDGELKIGNGNHRLVAALFCGITEIPVYVTDWCDWTHSEDKNILHSYIYNHGGIEAFRDDFADACEAIYNDNKFALIENYESDTYYPYTMERVEYSWA